ncbi:hypothetical protein LSTR_LSTR014515 [Laodelphax striatellus]|uniref:Uncharacterized protein n=1 Tax=Laodelphax striatellus TaxID=195883 RepID=A0A482XIL2_LAOST|nr:hypothetical protein LSTR_LSTR014515 [Laodelphax striatellus]
MRESGGKMAELKFEAPLAQFEETDEWGATEFHQNIAVTKDDVKVRKVVSGGGTQEANNNQESNPDQLLNDNAAKLCVMQHTAASVADNFTETFSGSLEDLVNTFDDKITRCFCNYDESVEKLAPVQVRTQEEIMNECQ